MENSLVYKIQSKNIRVFISSTFKDMQAERDIIVKKVFPRIKHEAENRGVNFSYVDLRWGIKPNAKSYEILDVCLSEIENCNPYFIGLIGNKYGTIIPRIHRKDRHLLEYHHKAFKTLWDTNHNISYTEAEIKYYKLLQLSQDRTFIYMKDEELNSNKQPWYKKIQHGFTSILNHRKIYLQRQLIEYICSKSEFQWTRYSGSTTYENSTNLEDIVYKDFINILNEICPHNSLSFIQSVRNSQESFIAKTLVKNYINIKYPKAIYTWAIENKINNTCTADYFLLIDRQDNLKTIYLADFVSQCIGKWNILYHFVGASKQRETPEILLYDLILQLCNNLNICAPIFLGHETKEYLIDLLTEFLERCPEKTFIVIDNIDQIQYDSDDIISCVSWLPNKIIKLKYLISVSDKSSIYLKRPNWLDITELEIQEPTPRECYNYTKEYLKSRYGKSEEGIISPDYFEKRQHACLRSRETLILFLDVIATFNFGMDKKGYDLINKIERLVASKYNIIEYYIDRIETEIFHNEKQKAIKILSLLAITEFGIHENDVVNILSSYNLGISQIEWSKLFCQIKDLVTSEGYITVSTDFKKIIISRYLPSKYIQEKERINLAKSLLAYNKNNNYTTELAYQFLHVRDYENIKIILSNPQSLIYLYRANKKLLTECLVLLKSKDQIDIFIKDLMQNMDKSITLERANEWESISRIFMSTITIYPVAIHSIDTAISIRERIPIETENQIERLIELYHKRTSILTTLFNFEKAHDTIDKCFKLLADTPFSKKSELLIKSFIEKAKIYSSSTYHMKRLKAEYHYRQAYALSQDLNEFKDSLTYIKLLCRITNFIDNHTDYLGFKNEISKIINYKYLNGTGQYFQAVMYYRICELREIQKFDRTRKAYETLIDELLTDLKDLININGQYHREYAAFNMILGDVYTKYTDYLYNNNDYTNYVKNSDRAVKYYDAYAFCVSQIFEQSTPQYALSIFNLAKAYQNFIETRPMIQNEIVNKCLSLYLEAEKIYNNLMHDNYSEVGIIYHNISHIYCTIKQHNTAIRYIDKAIAIKQRYLKKSERYIHSSIIRKFYIIKDSIIYNDIKDKHEINNYISLISEYYNTTKYNNDISDLEKAFRLEQIEKYNNWIDKWQNDTKICFIEYANDLIEIIKKMLTDYIQRIDTNDKDSTKIFYRQLIERWRELTEYIEKHDIQTEFDNDYVYNQLKRVCNHPLYVH